MNVPQLLTIPEAAKVLRLSRNGLKNIIARKLLPVVRLPSSGKRAARVLIQEADILAFVEASTSNGNGNGEHRPRSASRNTRQNGGQARCDFVDVSACGKERNKRGGARIRTGG